MKSNNTFWEIDKYFFSSYRRVLHVNCLPPEEQGLVKDQL